MDLNNDGIEEEICYKCIEDEENEEYISELTINGTNEVSLQGNLEPYIWVVDVDPKDCFRYHRAKQLKTFICLDESLAFP